MKLVLVPLDGTEESNEIVGPIIEHLSPQTHRLLLARVRAPGEFVQPEAPVSRREMQEPALPTMSESLVALHVSEVPVDEDAARVRAEQVLAPARHRLEAAGFNVETVSPIGDPAAEIQRIVSEGQVSLVAMVTHGRKGVARLLLGSIAEHVVRHTPAPVLVLCVE